ncbi:MAG TPA: polysaccharide biosynthesis C-terminal domain-containing protein, partial [Ardenticatenaceae bacterium]|nr:polysaccharide biosynthesis C-terminal domain-containing protein [Ardenticatenaceae bacterium]
LRAAAVGAALLALVTLMGGVAQAAGQRRAPAIASAVALAAQLAVLVWSVPRWGTLGAALSLVAAGVIALALLAPVAILPFLRGETAQAFIPGLLQAAIPLAALAVPLLLLPDGGRAAAFVKLAVGSLAYVLALLGVRRPWVREVRARATPPTGQRLVRFMHILIAG